MYQLKAKPTMPQSECCYSTWKWILIWKVDQIYLSDANNVII